MDAAFFDLDKTVITKASMMAFGPAFYREGLISRSSLVKAVWIQLVYLRIGASSRRLARIGRFALAVTRGWEQSRVHEIVSEGLAAVVDPITYAEARRLIGDHQAAGRRVYIVSAAPAEIVEPLARHLGVHEAIASLAELDGAGRYTGRLHRYAAGPVKASLVREVAERDGIDLRGSWAYSDSATDLPMLEAVGHPVAVNPDRALRRIARLRGWEVQRFEQTVAQPPVRTRARAAWARPTAVAAATSGVGLWAWARRATLRSATRSAWRALRSAQRRAAPAQLERSFLAARTERPSSRARTTSFFMAPERSRPRAGRTA